MAKRPQTVAAEVTADSIVQIASGFLGAKFSFRRQRSRII